MSLMKDRDAQKYDNTLTLLYQSSLYHHQASSRQSFARPWPRCIEAKQSNPYNLSQHLKPSIQKPKGILPVAEMEEEARQYNGNSINVTA
jgi:hypothetical protein